MTRPRLQSIFHRAKALFLAAFGLALMLVAAPVAAVHIPASFPMQFLGGCSVVAFFFLGALMAGDGLTDFERLGKPKPAAL